MHMAIASYSGRMPLDLMQWRPRQRPWDAPLNAAAGLEYLRGCRRAFRSLVATDRSQRSGDLSLW
eukprot:10839238-Lingulodinium_polyedra.AAC.1